MASSSEEPAGMVGRPAVGGGRRREGGEEEDGSPSPAEGLASFIDHEEAGGGTSEVAVVPDEGEFEGQGGCLDCDLSIQSKASRQTSPNQIRYRGQTPRLGCLDFCFKSACDRVCM